MRPVNLIPTDERGGARRPLRSGPVAYVVLGSLLAALAAVTVLVVTNNQIADGKTEITRLNTEIAAAEARAAESASYAQFHQVAEQRATTIANLADSRFDWEKVMRQLSLVIPSGVTLTNLTGTVKPGVSLDSSASSGLRESVAGPALQLVGCAEGQEGVAVLVNNLKEIDGVTRVGMQSSELAGSSEGESVSANGNCSGDSAAQFQIVVAFDAAPIPATGTGGETEAAPAAPAETATETASSTESSEGGEGE